MKVVAMFDGGSRGNPGPAGFGAVVFDETGETVLQARGGFVGKTTNNVAEYEGLIACLELAKSLEAKEVMVVGDSQLVIKQMKGEYRVKNPGLKPLFEKAKRPPAGSTRSAIRTPTA